MIIKCHNCGAQIDTGSGDAPSFCEYCGASLKQSAPADESYDPFASSASSAPSVPSAPSNPFDYSSSSSGYNQTAGYNPSGYNPTAGFNTPSSGITSSLGNEKANKYVKSVRGWAITELVVAVLRFVYGISTYGDIQDLESQISDFSGQYATALQNYVNICYAELFMIFALLAVSIALTVFAGKMSKYRFPTSSDGIFSESKKSGITASVGIVLFIIFFVVELLAVSRYNTVATLFDLGEDGGTLTMYSSVAWSIFIFVGLVLITVQSFALARSRTATN